MSELTNISSEYELISILQKIGVNYFGEELAQERIGMFGFITESFAHMYGALALDSVIRSKEYTVATALKRSTLNYAAYKLGIDIPKAYPTNITTFLGIKVEDILSYGMVVSTNPKTYKLVLEKDMICFIGDYIFKPEFDIEITAIYSVVTESYIYSAKYLKEGDTDYTSTTDNDEYYVYPKAVVNEDISDRHIPCYRTGADSKILVLKVDLKQLKKTESEYVVTDSNPISLSGIDFEYPDQLAYFNIYYKESESTSWVYMKAVPKYDTNSYDENVIYYEVLDDEHKVRFDFTGFLPQYNSTFRIDIYSTLGKSVNSLNYVGDGADIKISIESPDSRHTYAGLSLACSPLYTSATGRDTLTMDEMRTYIVKNTSLLNAVVTERDISTYLDLNDEYNDYYIRKTRSDIVNMTYDVNSKIRTIDNGIIPTRCVDIEAPENGTILSSGEDSLNTNDRYCCPYDIVKTSAGVTVYASNINERVNMRCIDTDTSSEINFRIDHVNIKRDINSDEYKITVSVMTDGDYTKAVSGNIVNTGIVKKTIILRGFIYSDASNNIVSGIFNFNFVSYSNGIFVFEATLGVDPSITSGAITLKGTTLYNINDVNPGASTINADHEYIINDAAYNISTAGDAVSIAPKNFIFGIGCYYLEYSTENGAGNEFLYVNDSRLRVHADAENTTLGYMADTIAIPGSGNAYPKYTGLVEYENGTDNFDYKLCDVYSNMTDPIDLYVDMSDIIHIDTATVDGDLMMKDIPCIEYDTVSVFNDRMHDIMFGTKDLLEVLRSKLLNNFETDYKFYNTSGNSNYFTIGFTNGTNFTSIGDLELLVNVSIGLTDEYATLETTKLIKIKTAIKTYIESGFTDATNNKLYMSNVLSAVNKDFAQYIKYIELDSINGLDSRYRVIQYTLPTDNDTYVSEFVSVPISNITVTIE